MQFIQKNRHFFSLIVLTIACLLPLLFTRGKLLIGGDIVLPLNVDGLYKFLFQWYSTGNGSYFALNYLPYSLMTLFLPKLDIYAIYAFLLFFLNVIGVIGIIKLVRLLFGKGAPYLFPALFFVLSPALLNTWHYSFIYYFAPLFIYLILKFVISKQISWVDTLIISFILFFSTIDLPNPKYLFHFLLITLLIFGISFYLKIVDVKFFIKALPKFFVIILLSSYIFIPLANFVLYYSPDVYNVDVKQGYLDSAGLPDFKTTTADKMFQLHHDNVYLNKTDKQTYLNSPLSIVGNYMFFGIILLDLIINRKSGTVGKIRALIFYLALVYLFFSIGPNPPFGIVYTFIVKQFSVLMFLRTTSGAAFFVSVFYSIMLSGVLQTITKRKIILIALLTGSLIAASYPVLLGQYFKNQNYVGNKYIDTEEFGYIIPKPYAAMKNNVDAITTDSKILNLFSSLSYTDNSWGYFGNNLYTLLFEHTSIGYKDIISDLPYHNVSHVLLDNSLVTIPNVKQIDVKNLELVSKNGFLELYKIPDKNILPHFYVPKTSTFFAGSAKLLDKYSKLGNWGIDHEYYVTAPHNNPDYLTYNEIISPITRRRSVVIDNYYKWDKGWSWPNATTNPNSFIYPITKLKEGLVLHFTSTILDKLDLYIWLSSKRAEELSKFKLDIATSTGKDVLADYYSNQKTVIDELYSYDVSDDELNYWGMVNKAINYFDKANQLILSSGVDKEQFKTLNSNYEIFKQWASGYINSNCGYYCYDLKITKDGNYTLLVDQTALKNANISDIHANIEGTPIDKSSIRKENNWYSISLPNLKASYTYHFGLQFEEQENLLEIGSWKKYYSVGGDDTLNLNAQNLFPGFNLIKDSKGESTKTIIWGDSLTYKNILNWAPQETYKLSFDYAVSNGTLGLAVAEDIVDFTDLYKIKDFSYLKVSDYKTRTLKKSIFSEGLQYSVRNISADTVDSCLYKENDVCFKHYEKIFVSGRFSKSGQLVLYNVPDIEMSSNAIIRNIKIQRHIEPSIYLKSTISDENKKTPEIYFRKINPSKYLVSVSGATMPYSLIFSERFHDGWKVYFQGTNTIFEGATVVKDYLSGGVKEIEGTKYTVDRNLFETNTLKRVLDATHYTTNGYANAWFVDPSEFDNQANYNLIIEFEPQKTYYYSVIISVITFMTVIILGAYAYIHKKIKK